MLKTGHFKVTAITRPESTNTVPSGVELKKVDYTDTDALVSALQGHDVLIITLAVSAPPDQESKLVKAAAAANVPWVLPNEWGSDILNEEMGRDNMLGEPKKKTRDLIEQLGKSSWIAIVCNFWYEYSLSGSSVLFGFDFKDRTVTFYDDGQTRINTSTWPQTGRSVAKLLSLKVLPDDENDKSPSLEMFRNKPLYVSSFNINQRDMLDSVLRVTGAKQDDWKITHEPVKDRYKAGVAQLRGGDRMGFGKLLYARMFYPDQCGNYEDTRGLHNDLLGLPKEDLDEFTKIAVDRALHGPKLFQ